MTYYFCMIKLAASDRRAQDLQLRYHDNFARHLMGVSLYLQSEIMRRLTQDSGHHQLRINFEPYITIIGERGVRLSDIAKRLQISRQAANQAVNMIEAAGYIRRQPDPGDGRAKLLVTTQRGNTLRRDGAREASQLQQKMRDIIGTRALRQSIKVMSGLCKALNILLPVAGQDAVSGEAALAGLLPRLSDYTSRRLMQLTIDKGHPGLKLSFGQVLTAIGPAGGRIQKIADHHQVTKQAISAVAMELEDLGYIQRDPDPTDARQVLLRFTDDGRGLIADSVDSVDQLRREFAAVVGSNPIKGLTESLKKLYDTLHLEQELLDQKGQLEVQNLANQLRTQLGNRDVRALATLLLATEQA